MSVYLISERVRHQIKGYTLYQHASLCQRHGVHGKIYFEAETGSEGKVIIFNIN